MARLPEQPAPAACGGGRVGSSQLRLASRPVPLARGGGRVGRGQPRFCLGGNHMPPWLCRARWGRTCQGSAWEGSGWLCLCWRLSPFIYGVLQATKCFGHAGRGGDEWQGSGRLCEGGAPEQLQGGGREEGRGAAAGAWHADPAAPRQAQRGHAAAGAWHPGTPFKPCESGTPNQVARTQNNCTCWPLATSNPARPCQRNDVW